MRRHLCIAVFAFLESCVFSLSAFSFDGPLQARNQFPLLLPLDPPSLQSAEIQNAFSVGLSHSSVFVVEDAPGWSAHLDMELTELNLRFTRTIGAASELGLEVPFLRPSGGFFDQPLDAFHDFLGWGDYGRSSRPMNAFLYTVSRNGSPVVRGVNDRTGIGDVRLTFKRLIVPASPTVSLLGNVELPTGDPKTGYGSGSVDAAVAVIADTRLGEGYMGFANAGVVFPGDFRGHQTVPLRDFVYVGFGVEAEWWSRFSVLAQTLAQSSPFPKTGIRQLDRPGVLLTIGGRYYFDRSSLEFSLTEDPSTANAPDFTANVTFKKKI